MSKDAFGLGGAHTYTCNCGHRGSYEEAQAPCDDANEEPIFYCAECGATILKKARRIREEILFTQIKTISADKSDDINFEQRISDQESMYGEEEMFDRKVDFLDSLDKLSSSIDEKTAKIIELICLEDYSIKDAASVVGLSGWAASMRLKNLSKNKIIKDMFDKKR